MSAYYEYKGLGTSLNGLTNYMYNARAKAGIKDRCSAQTLYDKLLIDIVQYGIENIPNFKKKGHVHVMADRIAVKVQKNKKFNQFKEWYDKYISSIPKN